MQIGLYNATRKWNEQRYFKDIVNKGELIGDNIVNFKYQLFEVNNEYTKEELIENNNISSAIFLLDQKVEPLEFLDRLKAVALEFNRLTDREKVILNVPAVVRIVLYNAKRTWNAPRYFRHRKFRGCRKIFKKIVMEAIKVYLINILVKTSKVQIFPSASNLKDLNKLFERNISKKAIHKKDGFFAYNSKNFFTANEEGYDGFKYRKEFNKLERQYQINNWDAGWYQIKALLNFIIIIN